MFDADVADSLPPGPELAAVLAAACVTDLDADQSLTFVTASDRQAAWQDSRRVEALGQFADCNATIEDATVPGAERVTTTGGDGTPGIAEFAIDEVAAAVGITRGSAHGQIATALDLRHRLPLTYTALREGRVAYWRAKMVAEQTRRLDRRAAHLVDERVSDKLAGLGWRRLRDAVDAAAMDADPVGAEKAVEQAKPDRGVDVFPDSDDGLKRMSVTADTADVIRFDAAVDYVADLLGRLGDPDPKAERRAKAIGILAHPHRALALQRAVDAGCDNLADPSSWPQVTLYLHFTHDQWGQARDGAATLEGAGPVTTGQARELLGHSNVTIKPVIDLEGMPSSDDRFARGRLREAVVLKTPHCPFASCGGGGRRGQVDHTVAAPRGPTSLPNLSPPCTPHHRLKTHGRWKLAQPVNGTYLWRSPLGRMYLVDRTGVAHRVRWVR